jgi:hypothetical protein
LDDLKREFEPTANNSELLHIAVQQLKGKPMPVATGGLSSVLKTWYDIVMDVNDQLVPPMSKILVVAKSDQNAFWMTFWRVVCNPGYKHMDTILYKLSQM